MLNNLLKETVNKHPDKTAIVYSESRISYKKLYSDVIGLAKGLSSIGVEPGDCIALVLPNNPEFITAFFAASKIHAVSLLVNPVLAEEEIKYYVKDSNAIAIITDVQRAEVCRRIISKQDRKISLIVVEGDNTSDIVFADLIIYPSVEDAEKEPYEGDVIYQYSSGSTGKPKRVGRTHKNLFHEALNFHATVSTSELDNILCLVPLFHAHGLGNCMMASVYSGATLIILEDLRKNGKHVAVPFVLRRERVLELIEKEKITIFPGVPFVFSALADTPVDMKVDVSSLRLCFSAGNFLAKETFDKFMSRFGIPIRQLYGCTEVGSFAINIEADDDIRFDSVGLPMKNNEVVIVDENRNALPVDTVGEIALKSGALTAGYCNMPQLNSEAFINGFFLTGDLGKVDKKGRLIITGRKKIFIETGGNKVDPLEIEDILITHPKVKEVVVVGTKGPFKEEIIKAVIVPDGECQEHDIIAFCRARLTSFKIPQIIEFKDIIPKSPLGKVLRKDLV